MVAACLALAIMAKVVFPAVLLHIRNKAAQKLCAMPNFILEVAMSGDGTVETVN